MDVATAVTLGDDPAAVPPPAVGAASSCVKSEAASQSPGACRPGNASPAPTAPPAQNASPAISPKAQAATNTDKQSGTDGAAAAAAAVEGEPAAMEEDATGQAAGAAAAEVSNIAATASTAQPMDQPSPGKDAEPAVIKQEGDAKMEESHMAGDEKAAAHVPPALVCAYVL